MLILTRRVGEKVYLGDSNEICVTVTKVREGVVSLGFDAPRDVVIRREELLYRETHEEEDEQIESEEQE